MNLLSSLLAFTARQIGALRTQADSNTSRIETSEGNITDLTTTVNNTIVANSNSKEVLWSGELYDDTITLSKDISNFDFIDIEYKQAVSGSVTRKTITKRIPAVAGSYEINDFAVTYDNPSVDFFKQTLTLSATSLVAAQNYSVEAVGGSDTWNKQRGAYIFNIVRVLGVKLGNASPSELTDIRVGADGVTYNSAGAAVRGQLSDLKSDITSINNEDLSIEHIAWADGGISLETGQNTTNSSYWRTESYYKGADYNKFVVDDVESYGFRYSKNNDTYTYVSGFQIIGEYVFDESDTYYYRFSPQKAGFSTSKVQLLYKSKIVEDILALKQLEPKIDELEESATITKTKNLYDASGFANTYLNWSDGTETSFGDARSSAFIEVSEGNTLEYRLTVLGQICPTIACYDSSQNYVQSKSLQALGDGGSWTLQTGTFIIPNGVKYIKFSSCRTTTATDSISINNVETLKEYVLDNIGNQWDGKKWAAFGTSITDTSYTDVHFLQPTGKYVPFLKDMSGMDVTNYGMAGAPILNNIMNKVLTTNLSAFDIVTIEGSVNDHAMSKALGEVGDVGTDTFAGAIYQMAKYVYENSNATLFFITDYVGRYVHINPAPDGSDFYGDCAPTKVNNDGLLQIDYINMMIKQCEYFGIPCITAGQDSGINLLTGNLYLMDHIHSSYVGGKQYAETIWKELKQYQPRVLTV